MPQHPVIRIQPLQHAPWPVLDPFLGCERLLNHYPSSQQLPALLEARHLGQDFSGKDGFSMYHGTQVPGFTERPQLGFDTISLVRSGWLDHSDSLGHSARLGAGDVQWLSAGAGLRHAQMFPLLHADQPNPLDLLHISLNQAASAKQASPHLRLLWRSAIPKVLVTDAQGRNTRISVIAGDYRTCQDQALRAAAPRPPVDSWAHQAHAHVAIWAIHLAPGASYVLPAAAPAHASPLGRMLYFYAGDAMALQDCLLPQHSAVQLHAGHTAALRNLGNQPAELLMLQGMPLNEPVARYGPFVLNNEAEVRDAVQEFRRTRAGTWPWDSTSPMHGPLHQGRFARKHSAATSGRMSQLPASESAHLSAA